MQHKLSFCSINILSDAIAEVIVNNNVEVSLEMVEEFDRFLLDKFTGSFGVLINAVNIYDYSFEAKLIVGSNENIKAIAVVNYNSKMKSITQNIVKLREVDSWNVKFFSGLELGWQRGVDWLKKELSAHSG